MMSWMGTDENMIVCLQSRTHRACRTSRRVIAMCDFARWENGVDKLDREGNWNKFSMGKGVKNGSINNGGTWPLIALSDVLAKWYFKGETTNVVGIGGGDSTATNVKVADG